jgi:hypothetical protein
MHRTAILPRKHPLVVANIHTTNAAIFDSVSVARVPNNLFRGLYNEMVFPTIQIYEDSGSGSFFLYGLELLDVIACGFQTIHTFGALDMEACNAVGLGGYGLPTRAVMLISPPLIEAIEMAHFVEQAIAILLFGAVVEKGDFDTNTTSPPIELTELAIGIVELDWNKGEFSVKHFFVELVKPFVHLDKRGFHILVFIGCAILLAKCVPEPEPR